MKEVIILKLNSDDQTLAESKILLLYILSKVGKAISHNELLELVTSIVDMNYFYFQQFLLDLLKESKLQNINNEKTMKSLPENFAKAVSKSIGEITTPYLENILYSLNKLNENLDKNNGEDVTGEKGNFSYQNTAYWNAGHTYYFHALAPMNSNHVTVTAPTTGDAFGLSNVAFTNEDGSEDLYKNNCIRCRPYRSCKHR